MNSRGKVVEVGPTRSRQTKKWIVGLALIALIVIIGLAFQIGRSSAEHEPIIVRENNTQVRVVPVERVVTQAAPKIVKAPEEKLRLAAISDSDWKKIGVGCSCSFTQGVPRTELLIAGGDGIAVFKPDGNAKVCTLGENQMQEMFDGETTIKCGQSRVRIKAFGKIQPGFDGHSSQARMSVIDQGKEINLTGTFGCAC